jgi:hypothetical protein
MHHTYGQADARLWNCLVNVLEVICTHIWLNQYAYTKLQMKFLLVNTQTMFLKIHISKWTTFNEKSNLRNWFFSVFDSSYGLSHSEDKHHADTCPTGQLEAATKATVYLVVMLCHVVDRYRNFRGPTGIVFTLQITTWSQHVPL